MKDMTVMQIRRDLKAKVDAFSVEHGFTKVGGVAMLLESALTRAYGPTMVSGAKAAPPEIVEPEPAFVEEEEVEEAEEEPVVLREGFAVTTKLVSVPIEEPDPLPDLVWPSGAVRCRCDGPEERGPWHKVGCFNRAGK